MIYYCFAIFVNAANQVCFNEFNKKKPANLAARASKFSFFVKHRDLKNEILFLKVCKFVSFTSMNACRKENSKFKNFKHSIVGPQNGFLTWTKEKPKILKVYL